MGDPAGIGPELCLRALAAPEVRARCVPVLIGDVGVLRRVAAQTGLALEAPVCTFTDDEAMASAVAPLIVDCGAIDAASVHPGEIQAACGRAAYLYIETAVKACLDGRVAAMATAPIHKEALHLAGVPQPGHTEILAHLTGATNVCMMLASEEIIVSLVTIHVGLARVPRLVTAARIVEVAELTAAALRRMGRTEPRLTVCALNPHAGEGGLFGREDIEIIAPAVAQLRARGLRVEGPLAPDTAFVPARRQQTDAYIAMYHDQGLIPFKMLAFEHGVNITLGLPIVRTSVDHGTAFDLAWQGRASAASLIASLHWAARLSGVA
ncbi:MAG: 4-hydroxythreonine-4-phosphate dehydrogenase PdxA [Lentisphaerae bacterium]|nr:4-hydroxythreonine-4-phosphate dehydrogenase PdxA [Lentisphaerota bacterium]